MNFNIRNNFSNIQIRTVTYLIHIIPILSFSYYPDEGPKLFWFLRGSANSITFNFLIIFHSFYKINNSSFLYLLFNQKFFLHYTTNYIVFFNFVLLYLYLIFFLGFKFLYPLILF